MYSYQVRSGALPAYTSLRFLSVVLSQNHLESSFISTLREYSSQTNVILQYKLLATILSAVCSVIQHSQYVLHFYYTLYDVKYDCKITMHQIIFQLQCIVLLNNHQYNCNITKSFLSADKYLFRLHMTSCLPPVAHLMHFPSK